MVHTDLRALDDAALVGELYGQQHALVRARFAHSMGRLANTSSLSGMKSSIARIRTELRRREMDGGLGKNVLELRHRPATVSVSTEESAPGDFLGGVVDKLG